MTGWRQARCDESFSNGRRSWLSSLWNASRTHAIEARIPRHSSEGRRTVLGECAHEYVLARTHERRQFESARRWPLDAVRRAQMSTTRSRRRLPATVAARGQVRGDMQCRADSGRRHPRCPLRVNPSGASRQHVVISRTPPSGRFSDCGSAPADLQPLTRKHLETKTGSRFVVGWRVKPASSSVLCFEEINDDLLVLFSPEDGANGST